MLRDPTKNSEESSIPTTEWALNMQKTSSLRSPRGQRRQLKLPSQLVRRCCRRSLPVPRPRLSSGERGGRPCRRLLRPFLLVAGRRPPPQEDVKRVPGRSARLRWASPCPTSSLCPLILIPGDVDVDRCVEHTVHLV